MKEPGKLHRIRAWSAFRKGLGQLRELNHLTFDYLDDHRVPRATAQALLDATKDRQPRQDTTENFLHAVGLAPDRRDLWLAIYDWIVDNKDRRGWRREPHPASRYRWRGRPRGRWIPLTTVLVGTVLAAAAIVWGVNHVVKQHRHCGTSDNALHTRGEQCTGVSDGRDDPGVFGTDYKPIMSKIAAENARAMKNPDGYVTVAFVGPLRPRKGGSDELGAPVDPADPTVSRTLQQIEGAYIAQVSANQARTFPKVRLVVANMGADETQWPDAVEELAKMTDTPDHLVAAVGLGLSQQESVDTARNLAKAHPHPIPMVADIITADGFNATGTIDRNGPITGLVRTALDVTTQLRVLGKQLGDQHRYKTAALVWAQVTPQGTPDLYTRTLKEGFLNPQLGLKRFVDAGNIVFPFDPRSGDTVLRTISDTLCGKQPDMVFWSARQIYLPTFLKMLHDRPCHATPITVVAGSETTGQRRDDPVLHDPHVPISLLYVPLADPTQLDSAANPDRGLYQQFANAFTSQQFPRQHLQTGWAALAHDAMLTATDAISQAALGPNGTHILPTTDAVRGQLFLRIDTNAVRGATGVFRINTTTGDRINVRPPTPIHIP